MEKQNVLSVADFFITEVDKKYGVDNLKLNKIAYISLGFSLSIRNFDLFSEDVEAWNWGPVIPELYYSFKEYGSRIITKPSERENSSEIKDEDTLGLLNLVKDLYQSKSGLEIMELTHVKNTPWDYCYDGEKNTIIDKNIIKDYYDILIKNLKKSNILID